MGVLLAAVAGGCSGRCPSPTWELRRPPRATCGKAAAAGAAPVAAAAGALVLVAAAASEAAAWTGGSACRES